MEVASPRASSLELGLVRQGVVRQLKRILRLGMVSGSL